MVPSLLLSSQLLQTRYCCCFCCFCCFVFTNRDLMTLEDAIGIRFAYTMYRESHSRSLAFRASEFAFSSCEEIRVDHSFTNLHAVKRLWAMSSILFECFNPLCTRDTNACITNQMEFSIENNYDSMQGGSNLIEFNNFHSDYSHIGFVTSILMCL